MVGKIKQEECRLTNEQQEKLIELYQDESDLYGMYPVLPTPRKNVAKWYY